MITFTTVLSSAPVEPGVAGIVASDITAYVGGANPLVMVTPLAAATEPNLAVNMVALYPANSQLPPGNSGSLQARRISLELPYKCFMQQHQCPSHSTTFLSSQQQGMHNNSTT